MISRRLLRIKALHILFAFFRGENDSLAKAEKELFHSIKKGYDLYNYLFLLLLEIQSFAQKRIEMSRQKLMPTHEDLNPNLRFVENPYFTLISDNESVHDYLSYNKLSWVNYPELIKKLFQKISASDYYQKYMELPSADFADHRQVLVNILTKELIDFDDFVQCLEEQSIYWNDDLDFMIGMVVKTLKKFEPDQESSTPVFPMFKNEDDEDFAKRLLRKAVLNHDENTQVIDQYTKNWDVERIASMDILIMEMALTEITDFPSVPVKVSFNEYIEISKYYSTDQSSTFINGVLDKIIAAYRSEGKIQKQGRGLVGEEDM
ncbi:transcription antitermination factor NusB [Perlabentimonas gracilis]|jgi:N utilization substance protein B|uniref:transcription antitermination factor NusB n=1 Tax=Perlabentimonas gracilis TaxID=2715279 RepID=UPI0014076433|nr:transcription antitermination factor NusB [Perlabentimonas gracilis]NHB68213.1 transcription antitermination factor NusB [Perlabentimonas gracilis]